MSVSDAGRGPTLAKAYVQIIPSMRGFGKSMESELGGAGMVAVGKKSGGVLSRGLVLGAKAATGAIVGTLGVSLTKGFGRLKNIENAEAALRGLGMSAENIEKVMENANKAVKGTAFGLDEAAGAASLLSVAGVDAGKDMERHLTLVADLAAQTNSGMGEMSSIYGKVAANGKLTGEVAQQLLDRNINAYALVADHLGITTEAAQEMGRKGELSFEIFAAAMEGRVSGAAQEMGKTTEGAFKNMGAAFGRLGEAILEKVYPMLAPAMRKITEWVDKATEKVGGAIDWVSATFDRLRSDGAPAIDAVGGVLENLKQTATDVWNSVKSALATAWDVIAPILDSVWEVIETSIIPVFQELWGHAQYIFGRLQQIFKDLWAVVGPVLNNIKDLIINQVGPAIESAVTAVGELIEFVWKYMINPVFTAIKNFILNILAPVFLWLLNNIIRPVWEAIRVAIEAAWRIIKGVFDTITNVLRGDFSAAWHTIKSTISDVWDGIWGAIKGVWDRNIWPFFLKIGGWVDEKFVQPFRDAVGAIGRAWDGIKSWFARPINWVIDHVINGGVIAMINKITSALGLGNKLSPVGRIATGARAAGTASNGGAVGRMSVGAYAKGGRAPRGWALVGEEGPELVNFTNPGRVYTASETAQAITMAGADISPALIPDRQYTPGEAKAAKTALKTGNNTDLQAMLGSTPGEALLPIGGFGAFGDWISEKWQGITDFTMEIGGKVVNFARGQLANAAKLVIRPLQDLVRNNVSGVWSDFFVGAGDKLINWIAGVDKATKPQDQWSDILAGFGGLGMGLGGTAVRGGVRPLRGGILTSRFGVSRYGSTHAGIDLAAAMGTPIYAYQDGLVRAAGWNSLAGRTGIGVSLAHAGGLGSYYGHMMKAAVSRGQSVTKGQIIGFVGSTGNSTGPHLHWELSRGGNPQNVFNPLPYLYDQGGWIQPGVSTVVNKTAKPEPVLTADQWTLMERAVNQQTAGGPAVFRLVVGGREFPAYMEEIADGRIHATPGVRAASDFVAHHGRYSRMGG